MLVLTDFYLKQLAKSEEQCLLKIKFNMNKLNISKHLIIYILVESKSAIWTSGVKLYTYFYILFFVFFLGQGNTP